MVAEMARCVSRLCSRNSQGNRQAVAPEHDEQGLVKRREGGCWKWQGIRRDPKDEDEDAARCEVVTVKGEEREQLGRGYPSSRPQSTLELQEVFQSIRRRLGTMPDSTQNATSLLLLLISRPILPTHSMYRTPTPYIPLPFLSFAPSSFS